MKKKNMAVKMGIMLAVIIGIFGANIKGNAAENDGLRFEGIRDTTVEAGTSFSTIKDIDGFRNGQKVGYSVFYRGKKISSTNYINTKKPTTKGRITTNSKYHLLRYNLKSGNEEINIHRKIYIRDTKAPIFSGISNISINYGSKFSTIKGVTAKDSVDGKRGYSVYIAKSGKWYKVSKKKFVNTRKSGKYYLKYVAKDRSGNTTTKRRTVTVRPKPKTVKTSKNKIAKNTFKPVNTIHIYPKANDERGWWYLGGNQSKLYAHSARGEQLANFKKNSKLVVHLNGTSYEYQVYDKFLLWGPVYNYPGSSKSKEWRYVTRKNKLALDNINSAPLYLQTCYNDNSQVVIALAKPLKSSKQLKKASSMFVSNPQ